MLAFRGLEVDVVALAGLPSEPWVARSLHPHPPSKLYILVRSDLPPGLQLAQSGHAVAAWARAHRSEFEAWTDGPNNLVVLDAGSLQELEGLADGLDCIRFHEPDLGDELTAVATIEGRSLSHLPLAGRREPAVL